MRGPGSGSPENKAGPLGIQEEGLQWVLAKPRHLAIEQGPSDTNCKVKVLSRINHIKEARGWKDPRSKRFQDRLMEGLECFQLMCIIYGHPRKT